MKILKIIPITIMLTLANTSLYAENCSDIKMNSSVNIIKKLKCKSSGGTGMSTESSSESSEVAGEKKKFKLFKKPTWMK
mgnify:FL=1